MQRILDLGCGSGDSWRKLGLPVDHCELIGFDAVPARAREACTKYASRGWLYAAARGEHLPLRDGSVDGVFANVALPYMHIPRVLAEVHRILVPGGWLQATLHTPGFTFSEMRRSFPRPKQTLFRGFVLLNGMVLHLSGRVLALGNVAESCQTQSGMRTALKRAGFTDIGFRTLDGRFLVEGRRDGIPSEVKPAA